jgi:DNA-binding transcriptional LysR family regulator
VPAVSEWASRRTISLPELRNESFVAYSHDRVPILHSYGVSMCLEEGFYPNIVCEAWQASSILSFVAAGVGVALIPSHLSELSHSGVVFRSLSRKSPSVQLEIVVVWREDNRSPVFSAFLDTCPSSQRGAVQTR